MDHTPAVVRLVTKESIVLRTLMNANKAPLANTMAFVLIHREVLLAIARRALQVPVAKPTSTSVNRILVTTMAPVWMIPAHFDVSACLVLRVHNAKSTSTNAKTSPV